MEIDMNKIDAGNSLTITIPKETTASFGTSCIVCDEYIPLDSPFDRGYKICDKCKLEYLRKSAAYGEIWDTYLDDKLYDSTKGIFISLFSPFYDDLTFISKYSISCYKKTVEEAENFNKMVTGNNK